MPGRGSYGPSGKWIHDRANRIMDKGELGKTYGKKDAKSVAYAIATQQGHKVGKSPKKFRTPEGVRTAKMKHSLPKKEYLKTASGVTDAARYILRGAGKGALLGGTALGGVGAMAAPEGQTAEGVLRGALVGAAAGGAGVGAYKALRLGGGLIGERIGRAAGKGDIYKRMLGAGLGADFGGLAGVPVGMAAGIGAGTSVAKKIGPLDRKREKTAGVGSFFKKLLKPKAKPAIAPRPTVKPVGQKTLSPIQNIQGAAVKRHAQQSAAAGKKRIMPWEGVKAPMIKTQEFEKAAMLYAFFSELEGIEKDAGALRKMLLGGMMAAGLAGGAKKALPSMAGTALKSGKAAITSSGKLPSRHVMPVGGVGAASRGHKELARYMP